MTLLLAWLGGALQALASAYAPADAWTGWHAPGLGWLPGVLELLGLVLLVSALQACTGPGRLKKASAAAFGFGLCWLAGSTWWLYISMHRYGGLPAWMAALAVLALAAVLSLYLVLASMAYVRWRSGRLRSDAPLFAALWLLVELARARWFTGFPWAAAGYAHVDGPLAAWAPWVGVYGMGAVAALLAVALAAALQQGAAWRRRLGVLAAVALLWLVPPWLPAQYTRSAGSLAVTLIQGNVPQDEKFDETRLPAVLHWHLQALHQARGDLVVAAETAIPLLPVQMPPGLWDALARPFAQGTTHALFGVPLGDFDTGYTNSAVGLGPGQPVYRYDKHHLVPFGEFIPPGFHWFVEMMNIPLGDFNRGPLVAPSMPVLGQRVAPNICYEDLFGEELAARFADQSQAPTVLANLSNIGWFGNSVAVAQHLQISRLRTLELQRPMLRATNTGATAVIDHRGVVLAALAPYTQGVLEARVEGRSGTTPYAWWVGHWGLWPAWGLAGLVVLLGAGRAWRRRR
ncbi:MAG: apolipoprotein N-acyltransferase [Burkholderiales bacterium]